MGASCNPISFEMGEEKIVDPWGLDAMGHCPGKGKGGAIPNSENSNAKFDFKQVRLRSGCRNKQTMTLPVRSGVE